MLGHAFFDETFSATFRKILERVYQRPSTVGKLWESIYIDHIKELDMVMRRYPAGIINEFDSLDELRGFDPSFIENVDSEVFDNIVAVLGCEKTGFMTSTHSSRVSPISHVTSLLATKNMYIAILA